MLPQHAMSRSILPFKANKTIASARQLIVQQRPHNQIAVLVLPILAQRNPKVLELFVDGAAFRRFEVERALELRDRVEA